jgi:hypothetical protein
MAQTLGEMIEREIRKGMTERRMEKITLYTLCTGKKVETSGSYPYVSDEVLAEINRHVDGCAHCRGTLMIGSHEEQKY